METLALELGEFTRRSRSVAVAHSTTALTRGLEPGETVLVRDGRTCRSATVADIDFTLTDTVYRLELGRELSAAESFELRRDALLSRAGRRTKVDAFELLALLRSARDARHQATLVERAEVVAQAHLAHRARVAERSRVAERTPARVVGP